MMDKQQRFYLVAKGSDTHKTILRLVHARNAAQAEAQRLQGWKQSAMSVLAEWDKVFESLDSPGRLGSSKAASALTEVQRLRALVAEAEPQTGDNP